MQANIYNTQESVPNIQLERTRGSGVGGPLPLTNASQPSSFDSFQLYSYTANSNEDNNDNNNDKNNNNSEFIRSVKPNSKSKLFGKIVIHTLFKLNINDDYNTFITE